MLREIVDVAMLCLYNATAYAIWLMLRSDTLDYNPLRAVDKPSWRRIVNPWLVLSIAVVNVAIGWLMQLSYGQLVIFSLQNIIRIYDMLVFCAYLSIARRFLRPIFIAAWYGEVPVPVAEEQPEMIQKPPEMMIQNQREMIQLSSTHHHQAETYEQPTPQDMRLTRTDSNETIVPSSSKTGLEISLEEELKRWTPKAYRERMAELMVDNAKWGYYEPFLWNVDVEVPKAIDKEATDSASSSMTEIGPEYDPSGQWA